MKKVSLVSLSLSLSLLAPALVAGCDAETDVATAQSASLGSKPSFEVFQDSAGQFRFHLLAANHEIVLASEGYQTRTGALTGVVSVLANAEQSENFELLASADGGAYFNLYAQNGEIVATSEVYASKSNARAGIAAVGQAVAAYQKAASGNVAGFQRFIGEDGQFYFRLRAFNGQVVLQSEGYTSEGAALNGAFAVAENGAFAVSYKIKPSADGGFYFTIVAANGEVVGKSEVYVSKSNAERARDAIIDLLDHVQPL